MTSSDLVKTSNIYDLAIFRTFQRFANGDVQQTNINFQFIIHNCSRSLTIKILQFASFFQLYKHQESTDKKYTKIEPHHHQQER